MIGSFTVIDPEILDAALYDPINKYWLGVLLQYDQVTSADGVPLVVARFFSEQGITNTVMTLQEFSDMRFSKGNEVHQLVYQGVKRCRARVAQLAYVGDNLPAHRAIERRFLRQALAVAERLGVAL